MQRIDNIVSELKAIMQTADISQNRIITALGDKCSRNTILTFFKGDSDCKLSTLLMILDACGASLRIDTELSRQAIMNDDISFYRTEAESLRSEVSALLSDKEYLQSRNNELIEKNSLLTSTVEKQQGTIEKYMARMEKAENAIYDAMENIKRKDARIVELSKELQKW